jgi:AAA15 family ATPase/GTPase
MIKSFKVKNYKGFKEEISLNFSDYKDYKYNTHAIRDGLIKTAVIYGRNASGKSNFGLALFDLTIHLVDKEQFEPQHVNYLNADSDLDKAFFEYVFVIDGREIKYAYQKTDSRTLLYEELFLDGKKVFSFNFQRQKGDFVDMSQVDAVTLDIPTKGMHISVVRFIANNANLGKQTILRKFMDFVSNMLWYRSLGFNQFIGYAKGGERLMESIIKNGKLDDFQQYLKSMGISFDLQIATDPMGSKFIAAKFKQKLLPFLEIASSGTLVLTLHYFWSQRFKDVSFLFVDEFDAFYHANLAESILTYVASKSHFQSIFTTHNTSLMSNQLLRPDCYFIMSEGKLNALPDCTERELREGHNLEKMFRNGEFI